MDAHLPFETSSLGDSGRKRKAMVVRAGRVAFRNAKPRHSRTRPPKIPQSRIPAKYETLV